MFEDVGDRNWIKVRRVEVKDRNHRRIGLADIKDAGDVRLGNDVAVDKSGRDVADLLDALRLGGIRRRQDQRQGQCSQEAHYALTPHPGAVRSIPNPVAQGPALFAAAPRACTTAIRRNQTRCPDNSSPRGALLPLILPTQSQLPAGIIRTVIICAAIGAAATSRQDQASFGLVCCPKHTSHIFDLFEVVKGYAQDNKSQRASECKLP